MRPTCPDEIAESHHYRIGSPYGALLDRRAVPTARCAMSPARRGNHSSEVEKKYFLRRPMASSGLPRSRSGARAELSMDHEGAPSIEVAANMAGIVGCAKSQCEVLRLDTGLMGDFAHAVEFSGRIRRAQNRASRRRVRRDFRTRFCTPYDLRHVGSGFN